MCGRFAQKSPVPSLAKNFDAQLKLESLEPRYNISPTSIVPVVRIPHQETKRTLEGLKWGLIPSWASDPSIGFKLANARAETVADKPSFRSAFKKQRCLVPIDGFFEWKQDTKPKQPFYFFMKDEKPFALAGLWEYWKPKTGNGEPIYSFTLITTEPNSLLAKVHDRMPVIIDPKDFEEWLDPANQDPAKLTKFLKPYPASKMDSYPVSTFVNAVKNQGPACIEALKA